MQSVVQTIVDASDMIQNQHNTISVLNTQVEADNDDFGDIYRAIIDKGQSPTQSDRDTYAPAIRAIQTPHLQDKTITPTTSQQVITCDGEPYNGLDEVTVQAVTAAIDQNIQQGNIKKAVTILGVTGTYEGGGGVVNLQNKTIDPSTSQQQVQADHGYDGLDTVTVEAVTSAIDQNITAQNIRNGVTVLGIQGLYTGDTDISTCIKEVEQDGLDLYSSVVNLAKPGGSNLQNQNWGGVINNVIHIISNNSHYTYDPLTDTFTLIDTDSKYEYRVNGDGIGGCVISDKLVWVNDGPFKVSYWSAADGLVEDVSFRCPDQTYARSICTDGTYLYVAGSNSGKLYKIDIANKTFTDVATNISGQYSLAYLDGYVYGHKATNSDNKIYKINVSTGVESEVTTVTGFKSDTIPITIDNYIYYFGGNTYTYDKYVWKFDGTTLSTISTNAYASYGRGYFVHNNILYSIGVNRTNSFVKLGQVLNGAYNYVTAPLGSTMYVYSGTSPVVETTNYCKVYKLHKSENFIIVKDEKVLTYNVVNNYVYVKSGMTINNMLISSDQLYDVSNLDQVYIRYT